MNLAFNGSSDEEAAEVNNNNNNKNTFSFPDACVGVRVRGTDREDTHR